MYISLANSRDKGFKSWSDLHPPASNDNPGGLADADALRKPREGPRDPWPHDPGMVPGVGNTL